MTGDQKVSIVIVNWNGIRDTRECITSLTKIDYVNFEIIVVDNSSTVDEALQLKSEFPYISIIKLRKNIGFSNANNVGILKALQRDAEYVLLLNNDTIVDRSFLRELVDVADKDRTIGIAGPKMYYYDNRKMIWYGGGKLNMYVLHRQNAGKTVPRFEAVSAKDTDYVAGACMLVRRDVFPKVGYLPREYFLGWEDIDFCVAARRMNYRCVYVPSSILWHKVAESYKRKNLIHRRVFFGFRNRIIMRYKYLSRPKFILFLGVQFSFVIPVHILYYTFVYRDVYRVSNLFRGLRAGFRDMGIRNPVFDLSYQ
jgi:GT2 family glycosyltransferase